MEEDLEIQIGGITAGPDSLHKPKSPRFAARCSKSLRFSLRSGAAKKTRHHLNGRSLFQSTGKESSTICMAELSCVLHYYAQILAVLALQLGR